MAKKISALVIPAVIDTTGIDKGISSIKTKLSGVRGSIGTRNSGTGGVGGGGNFGAGLPHYGGSAVAIGAVAAVGAGIGGGRGGGGGGSPQMSALQQRMSETSFAKRFARSLQDQKDASSNRFSRMIYNAGRFNINRRANYSERRLYEEGVPPGTDNFQMRTNNIRRMRSLAGGLERFGSSTGRGYSSVVNGSLGDLGRSAASNFTGRNGRIGAAGLTIGLGGMAAAANAMRKNFTQGGIKANFSDISNLEGNRELYERAASIKRRTYGPTGQPSFSQAMVLGAEEFRGKGGGGDAENLASKTDTLVAGAGRFLGMSLESNAGIILGAYDKFKNSPWGGGVKMVERLAKIFT